MKTNLTEVTIEIDPAQVEVVIAWLSMVGFQAFEETQKGVKSYIDSPNFDQQAMLEALSSLDRESFSFSIKEIAPRNWNEEWEASWEDVEIDDFCQIIPSFRQADDSFLHTVVVDPKMAFGTGHHETTRSVIRLMKAEEMNGKYILDMGCGTGILGILALKMGASSVFAIDIDPWSVENTQQNTQLNEVKGIQVIEGIVKDIPSEEFDLIFANINKNVLLQDIPAYAGHLKENGKLFLSGFLTQDEIEIKELSEEQGLRFSSRVEENNWVAAAFTK
ncbi:MAG: 50S ribosomal protein L11 methyltransferase [Bacteroidota bacterium]